MIAIINGLKLGFILSFSFGPSFILTFYYAINKGKKAAFILCSGFWFSDLLHAIILLLGLNIVYEIFENQSLYLTFLSAIILFVIGIKILQIDLHINEMKNFKLSINNLFLRGFIISFFNPGSILLWIGMLSYIKSMNLNEGENYLFIISYILCISFTDIIKIMISHRLKIILKAKIIQVINKIAGILLIIFSLIMLIKQFYLLFR